MKTAPSSRSRRDCLLGSAAAFTTIGIMTPARAADFDLEDGHGLPIDHPINVRSVEAFARINHRRVTVNLIAGTVATNDTGAPW